MPSGVINCGNTRLKVTAPFAHDLLWVRHWRHGCFYEQPLLSDIAALGVAGAYVDCGANLGNHTLFFINQCPCSRVYCFEPVPSVFRALEKNVTHPGNNPKGVPVILHNAPVAERSRRRVTWQVSRQNAGGTVMYNASSKPGMAKLRSCTTVTLDEMLPEDETIGLVKLDIEGGELDALRGATRVLASKPTLVIEALTDAALEAQLAFLTPLGYTLTKSQQVKRTHIWSPQ